MQQFCLTLAQKLELKAHLRIQMRRFFHEKGFIEVDTPVLLRAPLPEACIRAPTVTLHWEQRRHVRYLQTSPEACMKRLMAAGARKIFQLCPVFRDDDMGQWHCPEFRLLEWYDADLSYKDLPAFCWSLWQVLHRAALEGLQRLGHSQQDDMPSAYCTYSMEELFLKHCGFSLLSHLEAPNLYACMRKEGIYAQEGDDYAMLFHRAFMSRIAPALARAGEAAFLCDYPAPLASLSALDPKDPRIAQRLEFFMGDLELGNGFQECRCAETQRARFDEAHAWHKKHMGQGYLHDNAAFLAALPQMPECVGMAIGWERLLASILNCASLAELEELSWQAV